LRDRMACPSMPDVWDPAAQGFDNILRTALSVLLDGVELILMVPLDNSRFAYSLTLRLIDGQYSVLIRSFGIPGLPASAESQKNARNCEMYTNYFHLWNE
jgi:hypothetical protein